MDWGDCDSTILSAYETLDTTSAAWERHLAHAFNTRVTVSYLFMSHKSVSEICWGRLWHCLELEGYRL